LFLTALGALRSKVWRAFRFRHSGLTSVLSALVLRPFQIIFPWHGYVSLSCIPSGLASFLLCDAGTPLAKADASGEFSLLECSNRKIVRHARRHIALLCVFLQYFFLRLIPKAIRVAIWLPG
jgi:hypothetical protein